MRGCCVGVVRWRGGGIEGNPVGGDGGSWGGLAKSGSFVSGSGEEELEIGGVEVL